MVRSDQSVIRPWHLMMSNISMDALGNLGLNQIFLQMLLNDVGFTRHMANFHSNHTAPEVMHALYTLVREVGSHTKHNWAGTIHFNDLSF